MLELEPLDYEEVNWSFEQAYPDLDKKSVTAEQLERVPRLRLHLKNAVMHFLI